MLRAKCGCDSVPDTLVERIRSVTVQINHHEAPPSV
jgi:hypothetical protein